MSDFLGPLHTGRKGADISQLDAVAKIWPDGLMRICGLLTGKTSMSAQLPMITTWREWGQEVLSTMGLLAFSAVLAKLFAVDWADVLTFQSWMILSGLLVSGLIFGSGIYLQARTGRALDIIPSILFALAGAGITLVFVEIGISRGT